MCSIHPVGKLLLTDTCLHVLLYTEHHHVPALHLYCCVSLSSSRRPTMTSLIYHAALYKESVNIALLVRCHVVLFTGTVGSSGIERSVLIPKNCIANSSCVLQQSNIYCCIYHEYHMYEYWYYAAAVPQKGRNFARSAVYGNNDSTSLYGHGSYV